MNYNMIFSEMSGNFLTDYVPEEIVKDKDAVIDFISKHYVEAFEYVEAYDVFQQISDCAKLALSFHKHGRALGYRDSVEETVKMYKVKFSI